MSLPQTETIKMMLLSEVPFCFTFQVLWQITIIMLQSLPTCSCRGDLEVDNKQCVCLAFPQVFMQLALCAAYEHYEAQQLSSSVQHTTESEKVLHRSHSVLLKIELAVP